MDNTKLPSSHWCIIFHQEYIAMTSFAPMLCWLGTTTAIALTLTTSPPVLAQITPDGTTGSTVTPDTIRDIPGDRITGGARRAGNLFHSFEQFNIGEGRGAYFENPDGVNNIFSRVTGGDRSTINGRLGVLGAANLYFINPNGILFGANASLDVAGSFVGTTANAIEFGERGGFSATTPEIPSALLTVNPSALLFSQIPVGNLTNSSTANEDGLTVPANQSLLLVGGDVSLTGRILPSNGVRLEVGGLSQPGAVSLVNQNNQLSLQFPSDVTRSNVTLTDGAIIATSNG